jgi:polar amino acid transport system substrate-binding protein
MRRLWIIALLCSLAFPPLAYANDIAPSGTLRAVYLGSNPAQAVQDRSTGAIRGAAADLARELAKRIDVLVELKPAPNPQGVIDAVSSGAADIGFVAYEPSRAGTVSIRPGRCSPSSVPKASTAACSTTT